MKRSTLSVISIFFLGMVTLAGCADMYYDEIGAERNWRREALINSGDDSYYSYPYYYESADGYYPYYHYYYRYPSNYPSYIHRHYH